MVRKRGERARRESADTNEDRRRKEHGNTETREYDIWKERGSMVIRRTGRKEYDDTKKRK